MRNFNGKVAAITGAGSGIGRALAIELARRGAHVALSDIDEIGLAGTAAQADGHGVKVTTKRVDVSDRRALEAWADQVADELGGVHLIVNNAGVALVADAATVATEDFEWLMDINFWGVVHGTQAFMPHLKASGDGHVVNISSVFGLVAIPTQAAYNASKFAVRGYTDALRMELEIEPCGVSATTIHPGGIKTNIARNSRHEEGKDHDPDKSAADFESMARTTPEDAAQQILKAVQRNKRRALIGPDARVFDLVSRLPAVVPQKILVLGSRRERRKLGKDF